MFCSINTKYLGSSYSSPLWYPGPEIHLLRPTLPKLDLLSPASASGVLCQPDPPFEAMSNPKLETPTEQLVPVGSKPRRRTLAVREFVPKRCRRVAHEVPTRQHGAEERNQKLPIEPQSIKVVRKRKPSVELPVAPPKQNPGDDFHSLGSPLPHPGPPKAKQVSQLNSGLATSQLPKAKRLRTGNISSYGREILERQVVDVSSEPFPILAIATIGAWGGVREGRDMARFEGLMMQVNNEFP